VCRKDSQVKIHAQRVGIGEIESCLGQALTDDAREENMQIIAEMITRGGSDAPTLVNFLFLMAGSRTSLTDTDFVIGRLLEDIQDRLQKLVPPYMIPSAFLLVERVPITLTGKIYCGQLRAVGTKMYREQLNSQVALEKEEGVASPLETRIRKIWSEVLNLPSRNISLDSFTRLGGGSITATQVDSRCRSQNISIKVADILQLGTVRLIAQASESVQEKIDLNGVRVRQDESKPWALTPIQQMFFEYNTRVSTITLSAS